MICPYCDSPVFEDKWIDDLLEMDDLDCPKCGEAINSEDIYDE